MTVWVSVVSVEEHKRTVIACLVDTYLCAQYASGVSALPADPYALGAGHDTHPASVYGAVVVGRIWACGRGVPSCMQGTLYDIHAPGVGQLLLRVEEEEPGGCEDGEGGAVGGREGEGGAWACGGCA